MHLIISAIYKFVTKVCIAVGINNFTNCDYYWLVKQIEKHKGKHNVVSEKAEKYISIPKSFEVDTLLKDYSLPIFKELIFLDSYRFL